MYESFITRPGTMTPSCRSSDVDLEIWFKILSIFNFQNMIIQTDTQ